MAGRVLLTGATGFVGSHVARAFVEAGGARHYKTYRIYQKDI